MYIIALGLLVFLAGFVWGYRDGVETGKVCGQNEAPLALRMRLLSEEKCPICDVEYFHHGKSTVD